MKPIQIDPKVVDRYVGLLGILNADTQQAIILGLLHQLRLTNKQKALREIGEAYKESLRADKQGTKFQDAQECVLELLAELENE